MKTHHDRPSGQQSQAAQGPAAHERTGSSALSPFVDERPRTLAQRKLQDVMRAGSPSNDSPERLAHRGESRDDTGLPGRLKAGIESLSGFSMDDVRVHYNSSRPAQLKAHAYAQGTQIHIAPGQERHLPHEAWHVVQQKQGRVQPTLQMKGGTKVNDDGGLEHEADIMGQRAAGFTGDTSPALQMAGAGSDVAQLSFDDALIGMELTFVGASAATGWTSAITNTGIADYNGVSKLAFMDRLIAPAYARWSGYVEEEVPSLAEGDEELAVSVEDNEQKEWWGGAPDNITARKITVSGIPDGDDETRTWWLNLSIDPGVVEVQTSPLSVRTLRTDTHLLYRIFNTAVFGGATRAGFTAAGSAGGGHLNVDRKTGIGSMDKLPDILVNVERLAKTIEKEFPDRTEFEHRTNALLGLGDHGQERIDADFADKTNLFIERVGRLLDSAKGLDSPHKLSSFKRELGTLLHSFPATSQYSGVPGSTDLIDPRKPDDEQLGITGALHNSAVNIQHIDDPTKEHQRLEFRFFKAQQNMADIASDLQILRMIIGDG